MHSVVSIKLNIPVSICYNIKRNLLPSNKLKLTCEVGSRLTIVSREAKKKQRPLSEYFTRNTSKKFANAQTTPPLQLAPS